MGEASEDRRPLPSAGEDLARARPEADTPQTRSPSYRLAFADLDFLLRDGLRPVRLQLELLKPEMLLGEHRIDSTEAAWRAICAHYDLDPALADDES